MKYLCLIYTSEVQNRQIPEADLKAMSAEYYNFTQDIQRTGHYVGGNRLEAVASATTVRVREGKLSTTDGPFAETKEQLAGYYLIEAADLNEAIQLAARIPGARIGSVEVRPIAPGPTAPASASTKTAATANA
jgi:hypothetical protein